MELTVSIYSVNVPARMILQNAFKSNAEEWQVEAEREERGFRPVAKILGFRIKSKEARKKATTILQAAMVALTALLGYGINVTVNITSYETQGVQNTIKIENGKDVTIILDNKIIFKKDSCSTADLRKELERIAE